MNLTGCLLSLLLLLLPGRAALAMTPEPLGEPLALDWVDARHSDYLTTIKRRIQTRWEYRCVESGGAPACDDRATQLIVEFAVLTSGDLQYVTILRSSGDRDYDARAVRTIAAASPYPAVPTDLVKAGQAGLRMRTAFTHVVHPRIVVSSSSPVVQRARPATSTSVPVAWPVLSASLLLLAVALLVWRRRRPAPRQSQDDSIVPRDHRPDLAAAGPPGPPASQVAHDALLSLGWRHDGELAAHGFGASPVNTYSHPDLPRHRVNVSPVGEWEHAARPGTPARGSAVDDLIHHLGAIHGTLSIADLHLPGRRPG